MKSQLSTEAERRAKEALATKDEELVAKIFYEALNEDTKPPEIRPALALSQFSALLCKSAQKAERQATAIIWLTVVLVILTVVIAWFTIVLVRHEKNSPTDRQAHSLTNETQIQGANAPK